MIPVDFFGCKQEHMIDCSWEEACERFPVTSITIPDRSALASLSEALTGSGTFSAEPVPGSTEPFHELDDSLQLAVRNASANDLMDAGARWAQLPPWKLLDTNPMDLAGFLLDLQSLVRGPSHEGNSIFLLIQASGHD